MTPDQKRIKELEDKVSELERLFNSLRNAATLDPQIPRAINLRNNFLEKGTVGGTSGMTRTVDEAGISSYAVADAPDGSVILIDAVGTQYKVPYYT